MRELEYVLAKKQRVINDASFSPASGTHVNPQGNTENIYHWTECHYSEEGDGGVFNTGFFESFDETWTYIPHFRSTLYEGDLKEANADVSQTLKVCLDIITRLETAVTALEKACVVSLADVTLVNDLQVQNIQNHAELKQAKATLTQHLTTMTDIQRSCVLGEQCGVQGAEYLQQEIERLGFEQKIVAELAVTKQNQTLTDLVIRYGVSFDTNLVGDKTLVQLAVSTNNTAIISKVLAATPNCETSLLYALSQADIATVKAVLLSHPNLATTLLCGELTPLHYAIGNNQHDIIDYILGSHAEAVTTCNINGDSVLKIALRSGDDKTVQIIAQNADVETACSELLQGHEQGLIQRALDLNLIRQDWVSAQASVDTHEHQDLADLAGLGSHVETSEAAI